MCLSMHMTFSIKYFCGALIFCGESMNVSERKLYFCVVYMFKFLLINSYFFGSLLRFFSLENILFAVVAYGAI